MSDDWRRRRLEDACEILDRLRQPVNATERASRRGQVPYYGANGQAGWIDRPIFNETLVLLGEDAIDFLDPRTSKAYLISGPSWVNNHAHVLRVKADVVLPEFLTYSLNSVDYSKYVAFGTRSKLTQGKMKEIAILVPPLAAQGRIVDLIGSIDAHIANLQLEAELVARLRLQILLAALNSPDARPTPLGDCLQVDLDRQEVNRAVSYAIFGVLNRGQGLIDKGEILGAETGYPHLNRVRAGQLVMRKLTAWEGPIAVVPPEFDGYFGSAEFPSFTVDTEQLLPAFMSHVCAWPGLWSEMKQKVTGSVQRRKRLNPEQLLSVVIPLPPLHRQRLVADALDGLHETAKALREESIEAVSLRSALLERLLCQEVTISEAYDLLLDAGESA